MPERERPSLSGLSIKRPLPEHGKPVISIEDDELMATAIALMKKKAIRHIAVTEDGTIIGVLSVSDILRAYAELAGLNAEGQGDDDE